MTSQLNETTYASRRRTGLIAGAAMMILVAIVANAAISMQLHGHTLKQVHDNLQSRSLTLSESAERIFQTIELVLADLDRSVQRQGVSDFNTLIELMGDKANNSLIASKISALSYVDDVMLIAGDGTLVNSARAWPPRPLDLSDHDYFQALKDNADLRIFVSKPARNQITGSWTIIVARRLANRDRGFLGIAAAAISLRYFDDFYRKTTLGAGYAVSMLRSDGMLLVRHPNADHVGKIIPTGILGKLASSRSALSRHVSPVDGETRIVSGHLIPDYPVAVITTQVETPAFAAWRTIAVTLALVTGVISALIILAAFTISRSWKQQERINIGRAAVIEAEETRALAEVALDREREAALQSIRFNAAIENMPQGICMFDANQRLIVCNDNYAEIYGLTEEQTKPGTALCDILRYRVSTGQAPADSEGYIRDRIAEVEANKPYHVTNLLRSGRYVSVSHRPMADGGWVATHEDITDERRAEQELAETKAFLDSIVDNIPISVVVKDARTRRFVLVNRVFEMMMGRPKSDVLGRTVFDLYRPEDAKTIDAADVEFLENGAETAVKEYDVDTPARGLRTVATKRIAVKDELGGPKLLVTVVEDITDRRISEQKIMFMAQHDALTGLANRVALQDKIAEADAHRRRHAEPFSLFLLDLDRFKLVNDTFGHPVGDALLVDVASRLKQSLRQTDFLARLGGDEFAIVQRGEGNQRDTARGLANRIVEAITEPFRIEGHELSIGVSIGVALAPEHGSDAESLLKMADLALYQVKDKGRNGFLFSESAMRDMTTLRQSLEGDLRQALSTNELQLHYQPIVDSKTRKLCGAEALVRWVHPTRGMISPDDFIPLAEETGLIAQIGEWALHTACAEAATWPGNVRIAVNLSPAQFRKADLADVVMCALSESGLAPDRLELEITETALIECGTECLPLLRLFKNLGVTIALDDFGTGYSSLSQLTMFPFDKIKIDRSFTQNMTSRADCAAIISATLTLAHCLDLQTTAEGVDTIEQSKLLRLAGVTSLQGHYFQPPGPASKIDFEGTYGKPETADAA
jgi:diguanylate cyclase (GGDEF)-like protein/PAS domain S-box-containing protein